MVIWKSICHRIIQLKRSYPTEFFVIYLKNCYLIFLRDIEGNGMSLEERIHNMRELIANNIE